jgi:hypothetical protein
MGEDLSEYENLRDRHGWPRPSGAPPMTSAAGIW